MNRLVSVELPGPPQGKGRPRFARKNGLSFAYTPSKTRAYEKALAQAAALAMRGREPLIGPLNVMVWAYMPVPASWSRRKRDAALAGILRPTTRPDWENIAKVTDAFNGIVWKDDAYVVDGAVSKRYAESPRLRVEVSCVEPPIIGDSDDIQPSYRPAR